MQHAPSHGGQLLLWWDDVNDSLALCFVFDSNGRQECGKAEWTHPARVSLSLKWWNAQPAVTMQFFYFNTNKNPDKLSLSVWEIKSVWPYDDIYQIQDEQQEHIPHRPLISLRGNFFRYCIGYKNVSLCLVQTRHQRDPLTSGQR